MTKIEQWRLIGVVALVGILSGVVSGAFALARPVLCARERIVHTYMPSQDGPAPGEGSTLTVETRTCEAWR